MRKKIRAGDLRWQTKCTLFLDWNRNLSMPRSQSKTITVLQKREVTESVQTNQFQSTFAWSVPLICMCMRWYMEINLSSKTYFIESIHRRFSFHRFEIVTLISLFGPNHSLKATPKQKYVGFTRLHLTYFKRYGWHWKYSRASQHAHRAEP